MRELVSGCLIGAILFVLSLPRAAAQPEDSDQAAAEPKPTPPKLVEFVEAEYPPEALEQGLEGRVVLEFTVQPDGTVSDATVIESAGHGFDEAALEALKRFRFEPARVDGKPIAARMRYPYIFEQRAEEPPPDEQAEDAGPPPGELVGRILDEDEEEPVVDAEVVLLGEVSKSTRTDEQGEFAFEELPPGTYTLQVFADDYKTLEQSEQVVSQERTEATYGLQLERDPYAFGAVARIDPPPREVTRRTIAKEALTRIAGTRGDALRTVELMAGVGRPPAGQGALIIRGSSPNDSQTLFEGLPVPLLYHFGGLTSFINSRLLERIEFYPGNFSTRFGRRVGGIVEVTPSDPGQDDLSAVVDLNLIDASFIVETPIGEDAGVAVAARRSYIDTLFEAVVPEDSISVTAAPVYYDYQAVGVWKPSARDKLRLMVFGSSDELRLLFQDPDFGNPNVEGDLDVDTQFHRGHFSWNRALSDNVDQEFEVAAGPVDLDFGFGDLVDFSLVGVEVHGRAEWRARLSDRVRLIAGLDVRTLPGEFDYFGPEPQQQDGSATEQMPLGTGKFVEAGYRFTIFQPAVYLETDLNLDPVRVVLGGRVDHYNQTDQWSFDPRLALHYRLSDEWKLRAGVGLFSQPPLFPESARGLGNPELQPNRAVHLSAGFDRTFGEYVSLSVDGFYKHLFNRVVAGDPTMPRFVNDGIGRIYGAEVSGRIDPRGRFFGYLSYTFSRSERRDRDGRWRLFDFDQTHILTATATYRLGAGWETGATFRLISGNPETPIEAAFNDQSCAPRISQRRDPRCTSADTYQPVTGPINSERAPLFHRLDVRVEKLWEFEHWKLALYLDVQNAYNSANPEGTVYSSDFRESTQVRGLPILPVLGIRGEL